MNLHFKAVLVKAALGLLLLLIAIGAGSKMTSAPAENEARAQGELNIPSKRVLGPVVTVSESESAIPFIARVDTGAKTTSLHAEEKQVVGASKFMEDNVGKKIRFRIVNRDGQTQWLERTIAEVRKIRTSEGEETRYLVPMKLSVDGIERQVLVSLNNRSRMTYTMLLGRNFLAGHFLVDVTGADEAQGLLAGGL